MASSRDAASNQFVIDRWIARKVKHVGTNGLLGRCFLASMSYRAKQSNQGLTTIPQASIIAKGHKVCLIMRKESPMFKNETVVEGAGGVTGGMIGAGGS